MQMTALPVFPPIPPEQESFLRERMREMCRLQPALQTLRERLLAVAGHELVPPLERDPDLDEVLARGRTSDGRVARRRPGLPSECHSNVAQLYLRNPDSFRIVTGYALSPDGLWRQHSWALDAGDTPVETTDERVLYFGFVLSGREARHFAHRFH